MNVVVRLSLPLLAAGLAAAAYPAIAQAQQGVVAGIVTSSSTLAPIANAQVSVAGTQLGSITDNEGRFRITNLTGDQATLRVRRVGYRAIEQAVRVGDTEIRIQLAEAPLELDDVVITGTPGAATRRSIGNAVSSIQVAEQLPLTGANEVGKVLTARAPGVVITQGSGRVGNGTVVNIRGRNSLSLTQQPLLYIDGVRVANDVGTGPDVQGGNAVSRLNDIDPEDIESIEIIKGPAAATIYGTEASNGVIQIITKKGRAGATDLNVNIRQGTSWFRDAEGRMPTNFFRTPGGELLSFNGYQAAEANNTPLFRNGHLQSFGINLSGGTQELGYYLSANYDDEEGIEANNDLERFNGHVNLTLRPNERFDITSSVNVTQSDAQLSGESGLGTMFSALFGLPQLLQGPSRGFQIAPPEVIRDVVENTQAVTRFTGSLQIAHRPLSWLSHRFQVGLDNTNEDNQALTKFMTAEQAVFFGPVLARGQLFQDVRTISYTSADYSATAIASLTGDLTASTSIGGQYYRRRTDSSSVTARGFPAPGVRSAAAAATREGSQDFVVNTTLGFYVQEQLAWKDRLFLTGAVRMDDNSAFGEDFDVATYPKVSASWIVSEEPFWNIGFMDQLRLRAAYGHSGQQPTAFAALETFQATTGAGGSSAVTPQFPGNSELKPERGEELEVGFEASLFGRIGIDFTYFDKKTKDAILQRQLAPSQGFPQPQFVNVGEVSNHGVELLVTANAISRPNLSWDLSANVGTSKDRIEDMGGLPPITITLPLQQHREGGPIAGIYSRKVVSAEFNPATGRAINLMCDGGPDAGGAAVPCAQAPQLFLGTPTPKVTGAVTSTLTLFNRFRIYGLVDFKNGHKLLDADLLARCGIFQVCDVNVNPQNYDPIYVAQIQNSSALTLVEAVVSDASYTTLRELSLSITVPERWARFARASQATITFTGRNLYTWTDYTGLDPETRSSLSTENISFSQALFPTPAQFLTTINLSF
ncbi:MAG TPA: SusC/RagA family TonB-linked outer membrane protein [Gemmatimonadaceae bacterium]|nr:SusC/RagA family TonB-linked outer membrane protein [Gemmatimonadaceae bacterium]